MTRKNIYMQIKKFACVEIPAISARKATLWYQSDEVNIYVCGKMKDTWISHDAVRHACLIAASHAGCSVARIRYVRPQREPSRRPLDDNDPRKYTKRLL